MFVGPLPAGLGLGPELSWSSVGHRKGLSALCPLRTLISALPTLLPGPWRSAIHFCEGRDWGQPCHSAWPTSGQIPTALQSEEAFLPSPLQHWKGRVVGENLTIATKGHTGC